MTIKRVLLLAFTLLISQTTLAGTAQEDMIKAIREDNVRQVVSILKNRKAELDLKRPLDIPMFDENGEEVGKVKGSLLGLAVEGGNNQPSRCRRNYTPPCGC